MAVAGQPTGKLSRLGQACIWVPRAGRRLRTEPPVGRGVFGVTMGACSVTVCSSHLEVGRGGRVCVAGGRVDPEAGSLAWRIYPCVAYRSASSCPPHTAAMVTASFHGHGGVSERSQLMTSMSPRSAAV